MSEHDITGETLFDEPNDERRAVKAAQELIAFRQKWPDTTPSAGVELNGKSIGYTTDAAGNVTARVDDTNAGPARVVGIRTSEPKDIGIG